ncbi:PfkB family carbohydrate kinase [Spirillospora sp. CA-108201]
MKPERLVLVGSVLADLSLAVDALPDRGGDALARRSSTEIGGGFNVLAAAARNGLPCALAGLVGAGPFGDLVRAALAREGVEMLLPPAVAGDTGMSIGMVEPDGERTFLTSPGVESTLSRSDLDMIRLKAGDATYVSGYDLLYPSTGPAVAGWDLPDGAALVLDPGPLVTDIPRDVLEPVMARCAILTLNQRETGLLTGVEDPAVAAGTLLPRLPTGALLVLRRGAAGCVLVDGDGAVADIPAPRVAAVDTTGAGDAHTGVLLAALASGAAPVDAARRANEAAAVAVTRWGSATAPAAHETPAIDGPPR